ncbi:hypothetical protein Acr_27g0001050 [Actinidia rufa]|uniref:Uncharacterized protein n=1 Tax=Actinidia rufa TaxID=165716 RepID=A0A7J0H5J1_9ERIC|nr:hypothetical protein Acr_27g0001050 [Actinidia rufa]
MPPDHRRVRSSLRHAHTHQREVPHAATRTGEYPRARTLQEVASTHHHAPNFVLTRLHAPNRRNTLLHAPREGVPRAARQCTTSALTLTPLTVDFDCFVPEVSDFESLALPEFSRHFGFIHGIGFRSFCFYLGEDLHDLLENKGDQPVATKDEEWMMMNRKTIGLIRQYIGHEVFHHVAQETSAYELWIKLEEMYQTKTSQNKALLMRRLVNLKFQRETTVVEHTSEF